MYENLYIYEAQRVSVCLCVRASKAEVTQKPQVCVNQYTYMFPHILDIRYI